MIFSKEIIFGLVIFYFFTEDYNIKRNIIYIFFELYNFTKNCYSITKYKYLNNLNYYDLNKNDNELNNDIEFTKPLSKYECKYLDDILKLDNDYHFNTDEILTKTNKYKEYLDLLKNEKNEELDNLFDKLNELGEKIFKYEKMDEDYCIYDNEDEDYNLGETNEERIKILIEEKQIFELLLLGICLRSIFLMHNITILFC